MASKIIFAAILTFKPQFIAVSFVLAGNTISVMASMKTASPTVNAMAAAAETQAGTILHAGSAKELICAATAMSHKRFAGANSAADGTTISFMENLKTDPSLANQDWIF